MAQKTLTKLEKREIIPIIDKRKMVKEGKEIKRTVYYDDLGNVYCYCPCTGVKREMSFDGYEFENHTIRGKAKMEVEVPGENARKTTACKLDTLQDTYILEYIVGDISLHSHPTNVDKVYLSAEAPFIGKLCHRNESHQTFCGKTLVLKRIPK